MRHVVFILALVFICSLATATQTFFEEDYNLPGRTGEELVTNYISDNDRYVNLAFETVAGLLGTNLGMANLGVKSVVDYGCGMGAQTRLIRNAVGRASTYVGVDVQQNLVTCANLCAPGSFIQGDQNSAEVQNVLAQADIVFMHCVTMFQRDGQQGLFLREIFEKMKPGAFLVDIEATQTDEQESELISRYGKGYSYLGLFHQNLLRAKKMSYKFVEKEEKTCLENLTRLPVIMHKIAETETIGNMQTCSDSSVFNVARAGFLKHWLTDGVQERLLKEVHNIPNGETDYWLPRTVFIFVARKEK